jgi:hypothetical protein
VGFVGVCWFAGVVWVDFVGCLYGVVLGCLFLVRVGAPSELGSSLGALRTFLVILFV